MLQRSPHSVYLDYAATTPVDPDVAVVLNRYLTPLGDYANPGSQAHAPGRTAAAAIEHARGQIAALINAAADEICFTSGATESDNLAVLGTARYRKSEGRHVVTSRTEHKAVVDSVRQLEREGFDVTWLTPAPDGRLSPDELRSSLRADTVLVAAMFVNNEIGTIQPVREIGALCRERNISFHIDAAQAVGKLPVDVAELNADSMAFTAHKMYGPKGCGALYISGRYGARIEPLLFGGGQERGLRPGTEAVHQIAAFGHAAEIAGAGLEAEVAHLGELRAHLLAGLTKVDDVIVNGAPDHAVAGIVNVSVAGVNGESLMYAMQPIALSSGSACNSASGEPSYVLRALGRSDSLAEASLRFSFGRFTTPEDIDIACRQFGDAVAYLRSVR